MKTVSFTPHNSDRYIECINICNNGNLSIENNPGACIDPYPLLKERYINQYNYFYIIGRWRLVNLKMNNTIQRRQKRERKIKNMLWLLFTIVIALFIFSCSSDEDNTCNCQKETYSREMEHLYDTPSDESKCNGDSALRIDDFGTLYRYTCK